MASNVLEQLADIEPPPPPTRLDSEFRGRLNLYLTAHHLADLAFCGLPYAMFHFGRALYCSAVFSVCGEYEKNNSDESENGGNR